MLIHVSCPSITFKTGLAGSSSSLDSSEELSLTGLVTFLLCGLTGDFVVFSTGCCFFLEDVTMTGVCSSELSLSDELSSFVATTLDLAATAAAACGLV